MRAASLAVVAASVVLGCGGHGGGGGSSSQPLAPAGTKAFDQTATVDAGGGNISDGNGATVVIPAGALATGATVELIGWSEQRAAALIPTCTQTPKAIDIVVAPSAFVGNGTITVNLPWNTSGDPLGTTFAAFGPASTTPFVLTQTPASTQASPQVTISAAQVAFLGGVEVTSTKPVEFQIAIEQIGTQTVDPAETKAMSKMTVLWKAPPSRTHYAGRRRIALTVHGVMNTSQDVLALKNFLLQKTKKDGASTEDSFPFDEVDAYDYNYKDTIENNGALLATKINTLWGDPEKFEVHLFGHSMGGIVSRWAVEKSGCPSVVQLVTIGSPSNGVPIEAMRQWWMGLLALPEGVAGGLANVFAPGPKELTEGSALLGILKTSNVPQGVTFQAIGGTKPDLPTGVYLIALATVEICREQGRLPCDGFVPLDSALGNNAVSKLSVPYNHSDLCDHIKTYWPGSSAETWTAGINRKIAKLLIPTLKINLTPQGVQTVDVIADDKDGAKLDADMLFDASLPNGANPALKWTVGDSTIVSLSGQNKLSMTLTGLKAGSTTVTVKDPASGSTTDVIVQVGPGNVLITPANKTVQPATHTTYTVSLVTGSIPSGTSIIWTLTGDGTINGQKTVTSTSATVDYLAPSSPTTDMIAVELKDASDHSLGTISTPIHVSLNVNITPANANVTIGGQQSFTVAPGQGAQFPTGAKFRWTLTGGNGSLAGGNPVTTSTPSILYTAGSTKGAATLKVEVLDASNTVLGSNTATINVGTILVVNAPSVFLDYNVARSFNVQFPKGTIITNPPTFTYTLVGNGRIGAIENGVPTGSDPVTTTDHSILYGSPNADATATVNIVARDDQNKVIATGTFTAYTRSLQVSGTDGSGAYSGRFGNGDLQRFEYDAFEISYGTKGLMVIALPLGGHFVKGQSFAFPGLTGNQVNPLHAGNFVFGGDLDGSMSITNVESFPNGWDLVSFSLAGTDTATGVFPTQYMAAP